ncbi:hypothetical protein [Flavobacterium sp. ABG]|uniref:hypothetical protein n=1 Tax=Flavobacterium sp. ABG TaxID=1423322 RepID=UPI0006494DA3|nr:hypothetical protein [Flavobacterium sp. ABG]KLT67706.1 hypothetical protein AB674_21250 [Flavobacterium sp. ABG]
MFKKNLQTIIFIFICNCYYINAQKNSLNNTFVDDLNMCQLIYKQPTFYFKIDSAYDYEFDPAENTLYLDYVVQNKQNDITIAISTLKLREPNQLFKRMFPKSKDFNNVIPYVIFYGDTISTKPIEIDKKKIKELNADNGYIYNMKITNPYLNKYPMCKTVLIHKDNVSNAQILYFYTKKDENKVDDVIQKTWGMLKFKK